MKNVKNSWDELEMCDVNIFALLESWVIGFVWALLKRTPWRDFHWKPLWFLGPLCFLSWLGKYSEMEDNFWGFWLRSARMIRTNFTSSSKCQNWRKSSSFFLCFTHQYACRLRKGRHIYKKFWCLFDLIPDFRILRTAKSVVSIVTSMRSKEEMSRDIFPPWKFGRFVKW